MAAQNMPLVTPWLSLPPPLRLYFQNMSPCEKSPLVMRLAGFSVPPLPPWPLPVVPPVPPAAASAAPPPAPPLPTPMMRTHRFDPHTRSPVQTPPARQAQSSVPGVQLPPPSPLIVGWLQAASRATARENRVERNSVRLGGKRRRASQRRQRHATVGF